MCMRLWCFLCFGGEEDNNKGICEERRNFGNKMSDGSLGNVMEGEGDAVENDGYEGFEMDFAAWDDSSGVLEEVEVLGFGLESQACGLKRDAVENSPNVDGNGNGEVDVNVGSSSCFDPLVASTNEGIREMNFHLRMCGEPSSSSSALVSTSHNKRPKVQSSTL